MRGLADRSRIERLMTDLARYADRDVHVYLVGGATAVLYGWRDATIDVDLKIAPESDAMLRAIPALKERLAINVELASPLDFIPVRDDWMERSPFIAQHGRVFFHHFDLNAQTLAKIERGHEQDQADVKAMLDLKLVTPKTLTDYFSAIEPQLYRYPAVDPLSFKCQLTKRLSDYEHDRA
jgi:hypothetical protein